MALVSDPKDKAGPEAEGAPTELDVKLPSKIALAHAEETFEQRTTLPRVPLPSRAEIMVTPVRRPSHPPGTPDFSPQSFPPPARPPASTTGPHPLPSRPTGPHPLPPRPPASTTGPHPLPPRPEAPLPPFDSQSYPPLDAEFFRPTETVRTPKTRLGVPWIVLMLLGVVLGTGVTILLLRWLR